MKLIYSFVLAAMVSTTNYAFSQTPSTNQQADSSKITLVKVKGITCSMDLKTISSNVEKVRGVNSCKTVKQGATATFEVKFNPALTSEKDIHAAIEGTGGCQDPNDRPYKVKQ